MRLQKTNLPKAKLKNLFPDMGIGVGLRHEHYTEFLDSKPDGIAWTEALSENYMDWKREDITRPVSFLKKVRAKLPIALHGVSLSVGSVDKIDMDYLKSLKKLIQIIEPFIVSDHLCWTGVNGENMHDLLPLPYTEEAIKLVVKKVKRVQDFLGRRILLENVSSYVEFSHSEMNEGEFINEIAKRADCGILLDVNNVYVSSVNHQFNPLVYLQAVDPTRVGQIHLAGHTNKGGYLIDTHDEPVCDEVWNLYRWVVRNMGLKSAMIEWDAQIPEWNVLHAETQKIKVIRGEENAKNKPAGASKTISRRIEAS